MTFTREEYLEVLLEQARCKIEFLHGCLTLPNHSYAYPDMTETFLNQLRENLPERHYCVHSKVYPDCDSCVQGQRTREIVGEWEKSNER